MGVQIDTQKVLTKAIEQNGAEHQIIVAIEELAELQQALTKWLRYGEERLLDNIAEEMADVYLCLMELGHIFLNWDETADWMDRKIIRLAANLEGSRK